MNKSGIYIIKSIIHPDRIYIGSAVNIALRWRSHRWYLAHNKHHCSKMQRHCNKYGIDDLMFSIIEECKKEQLLIIEQRYIDELSPYFNTCKVAGNTLGIKASIKTRRKLSITNKGNKGRKGMPLTEEHKKKISESMSGINNPMFGKPSPKKGKKGYPNKNKGKKGIYSEETLQKMRISNKRAWEVRKQNKAA